MRKDTKAIIKIYITRKGEWHWTMLDFRNNRIIGASTERYKNRHQLISNLARVTGIIYVPAMKYGTKSIQWQMTRFAGGGTGFNNDIKTT